MNDGSINAATDALVSMMGDEQPEAPEQAEQAEQVESQQEAEPQEEGAEQEAEPQAEEYITVEYNGASYNVPKELEGHLLREADYTKKTQALAEQRKQLEAERNELPKKIETQYAEKLTQLENLLAQAVNADEQTDWKALLESDPVEYLRRKELAEERKAKFAELQQQNQARQQEHLKAVLTAERDKLLEKLPEWKDEKVAEKAKNEMKSYLQTHGFSQGEIDGITDHRVIVLLDKAMRFEALGKKDLAAKRIEKLPPKVERPGAANENKVNPVRNANLKLKQTGKLDDAAAAISQMFN